LKAGWRTVAAILLLFGLTVAFYRQLTLQKGYTWLENPDQALQVRPWLDYEARELDAGRMPLWDPYQVGGQSLIGQVQPGLANPLNWFLFMMPLRNGHIPINVLHWYWVGIHFLSAVFAFALCRDLKAGYGASLLGASIWAFGGFMGHSATPQFLMSALWVPIIVLFFARVFRGWRPRGSAAFCGVAMGLALLSGHHNVPIYTGVILGSLWVWYLLAGPREQLVERLTHAGIFAIVCLLVSSFQMLPAVEYGRQALRWSGAPEPQQWKDRVPYSVHAEYSLKARSIPGLITPGLGVHSNPFVGTVGLSLALIAVYLRWQSRRVRLLAVVALGALLLALGVDTPLHRIAYTLIPMVDKARYPAMTIVISQAAIAALAALGLDAAFRASARQMRSAAFWLAGFSLAMLIAYVMLAFAHHSANAGLPEWIVALVALAFAALLYFWPRQVSVTKWAVPAAALALFFIEVSTIPLPIQRMNQPDSLLTPLAEASDIADFLHKQKGWFRVWFEENTMASNFGDFYGIEQFGGYLASMPVNVNRILGDERTPRWFGIQYWVGRKPSKPDQVEVFTSRTGLKVYRNPAIEQPIWIERDAPCHPPDQLQLTSRMPGKMTVDVALPCEGRMVVGDPFYRGWRCFIDNHRVTIQEYSGVIRTIPVPAGPHHIEFRYDPGSVYWGAGLSGLGFLLAAFIYRRERLPQSV